PSREVESPHTLACSGHVTVFPATNFGVSFAAAGAAVTQKKNKSAKLPLFGGGGSRMNADVALRSGHPRLLWFKDAVQMPIAVAVAYFLGAKAAFLVGTFSDNIFAPFWPPNTILFCALLLTPLSRWWIYIAATFIAHAI